MWGEAELIELFESRLLKKSINFPTCNSNTLDVFFYQNCTVFSENDQKFDKTFNCSDHLAIKTSVDFRFTEYNPVREKYKSYGSGDYKSMIEEMEGTRLHLYASLTLTTCMLSTLTTLTGCPIYTFPQEQVTDKLCLAGFNRAPRTN